MNPLAGKGIAPKLVNAVCLRKLGVFSRNLVRVERWNACADNVGDKRLVVTFALTMSYA